MKKKNAFNLKFENLSSKTEIGFTLSILLNSGSLYIYFYTILDSVCERNFEPEGRVYLSDM